MGWNIFERSGSLYIDMLWIDQHNVAIIINPFMKIKFFITCLLFLTFFQHKNDKLPKS